MSEKEVWLFDVGGTLTSNSGRINNDFKNEFLKFCDNNSVYLVSGLGHDKIEELMGEDIDNHVQGIFSCNGGELWVRGRLRSEVKWQMASDCFEYLDEKIESSGFSGKVGNHYDVRFGMVKFSILGWGCDDKQRQAYYEWDSKNNERVRIVDEFNKEFSERTGVKAGIIGKTGIGISGKGMDKGRVLETMDVYSKVNFVCNSAQDGGNDYTLANGIRDKNMGEVHEVGGWKDTLDIVMGSGK